MSQLKEFDSHLAVSYQVPSICRDFLRNVCERGQKCKFHHPDPSDNINFKAEASLQDKILFCHDFQNSKCTRHTCKFLHCPREIEAEYQQSGYLPPYVREQMIQLGMSADGPANVGRKPVCKDNLGGKCNRGAKCKYRHVSAREYDLEMGHSGRGLANFGVSGAISEHNGFINPPPVIPIQLQAGTTVSNPISGHSNPMKRRIVETIAHFTSPMDQVEAGGQEALIFLQQENHHLHLRIQELEAKVTELSTTNDFLLDQNAKLRLGGAVAHPTHPHHLPPPPRPWGT